MQGVCYRLTGIDFQSATSGGCLKQDLLRSIGLYETLSDCLDRRQFSFQGTDSGVVIFPHPVDWDSNSNRFILTDTKWQKWGKFEVGYGSELIQPSYLARPTIVATDWKVTDTSGRDWFVPAINSPIRTRLAQEAKFDPETQEITFGVSGADLKLWEDVGSFMDSVLKEDDESVEEEEISTEPKIDDAWCLNLAVRILQRNYRVNPGVLAALHAQGVTLLTPESTFLICGLAADLPLVRQFQKKSGLGDLPELSPGVEVELPSSNRPGDRSKLQPSSVEA